MINVARSAGARRRRVAEPLWSLVRQRFARQEPIELVEQRHNFLPLRFRWRGHLWRVRQVRRTWDEQRTTLTPPRRYFQVLCHDGGDHILFQDLRLGTWHMSM